MYTSPKIKTVIPTVRMSTPDVSLVVISFLAGLPPTVLLAVIGLSLRRFSPLQTPTLLGGGDDGLPASRREFPFRFSSFWRGCTFASNLGPSRFLCLSHPPSCSGTEFPALACGCFRCGGGFGGPTV